MPRFIAYGEELDVVSFKKKYPTAKAIAKSWLFGTNLVFNGKKIGIVEDEKHDLPVCIYEINRKEFERYVEEKLQAGYALSMPEVELGGEVQRLFALQIKDLEEGVADYDMLCQVLEGYRKYNFPMDRIIDEWRDNFGN